MARFTNKQAQRSIAADNLAMNPAPNRPQREYNRITRALDKINDRISFHLAANNRQPRKWLPHWSVVTEKDDEWQYDLFAQVHPDDHNMEDDGFLPDFPNPGIKATNRISAITWYENPVGDSFIIKKTIHCPLPCEQWGRLPITLAQWRRVAPALVEMEHLWRWVYAVQMYTDDPSFKPGGIAGWHLEMTRPAIDHTRLAAEGKGYIIDMRSDEDKQLDAEGWTGQILLRDITAGFSLDG